MKKTLLRSKSHTKSALTALIIATLSMTSTKPTFKQRPPLIPITAKRTPDQLRLVIDKMTKEQKGYPFVAVTLPRLLLLGPEKLGASIKTGLYTAYNTNIPRTNTGSGEVCICLLTMEQNTIKLIQIDNRSQIPKGSTLVLS